MPLQIGIIGLPNVGKSTLFNVLTQAQNAEVANYPFCTIEPNLAIVPVPDKRLEKVAQMVRVNKVINTTIEFIDIAGLVKGASQGEGLGNQFLGTIRNTNALLHVVRCFDDPNVVHVSEQIDPIEDIEVVELELVMADLEQINTKIEKLSRQLKGDKTLISSLDMAKQIRSHLEAGNLLTTFEKMDQADFESIDQELRFLTSKPVIYCANIDEEVDVSKRPGIKAITELASAKNAKVVVIRALFEAELNELTEEDRKEYLSISGIQEGGLDQVIRTGYETLNLISFFTYNESEARAWTVEKGAKAPEAAGQIHTDFQKGFIKAEVIPFDIFETFGSTLAAKEAGKLQIEGKDYVVNDGDVIYFRFNL